MSHSPLAPRELFEKMLEYMPIPTFDLIIEYGDQGVLVVKRKIEPYKNVWALPGLRMFKGESIDDTLKRIAKQEVGLHIDVKQKVLVGQFVGKFSTENNRQDISTCYAVRVSSSQSLKINEAHFSRHQFVRTVPKPIGAMYKQYLNTYFALRATFSR
ncbi:NUDIX domain-containing protein [Patescibacteria group bacterium]|nr:NUDIX domain-containing protein [Patescibacteria group bacterium]